MIVFYWSTAAALASFAYFLSTLFSTAQMAALCCPFIYAISMLPAFLAVFGQVRTRGHSS
jgi:hypothetical protein